MDCKWRKNSFVLLKYCNNNSSHFEEGANISSHVTVSRTDQNKVLCRSVMFKNWGNFARINSLYCIVRNQIFKSDSLYLPSICSCRQHKFIYTNPVENNLLRPPSFNLIRENVRFKSKEQKTRTRQDDSDSEEEDEDVEEEFDERGNKVRGLRMKSLRFDNVMGKCMGFSRRKVEELFFESKFRLNGKTLAKKSTELTVGDYVEVCSDATDTGGTTKIVGRLSIVNMKLMPDGSTFHVKFTVEK